MTINNVAQYQVIVNWEDPMTQYISDFENGINEDWIQASGVLISISTTQAHSGTHSLKIADASDPTKSPPTGLAVTRTVTGLTTGRVYVAGGWAYIPFGAKFLELSCDSALYTTSTHTTDTWLYLETSFTAVASTHNLHINCLATDVVNINPSFFDSATVSIAGDDITDKVLGNREALDFREGRDQARSLSAIAPSSTDFEFINENRLYTPNNPASILNVNSPSGKPVEIRALFEGRYYSLYKGFIDDFQIQTELPGFSTLYLSSFDQLGRMNSSKISTALYEGIRSGDAIHVVLDEIGWPEEKRLIDSGASFFPWWWEEGTLALEAINKIVSSEGLPAFVFVDEVGNFVVRDRHHRYILNDSTHLVASFQETDPPNVS